MERPSDSRPSDLSDRELRKLKSRHADVNGTSPAMLDQHLPQDAKDLIQKQAYDKLTEQGWLSEKKESPSIADIAVSIFTLGIF